MPPEIRTKQAKPKRRRDKRPKRNSLERGLLSSALSLNAPDGAEAFEEWAVHLKDRQRKNKLRRILKAPISEAVDWLVPEDCRASRQMPASPARTSESVTDDAERWLTTLESRHSNVAAGLDALAWCHELASAADYLSRETWVRILDSLYELATHGLADPSCSWAEQILHVEVPLALAWQFPEIERCERLASHAADRLSADILGLLDGQGMIRGCDRHHIGPITACWTRCLAMLKEIAGVKVSRAARYEFEWLLQCVLRLVRSDGQLSFSDNFVVDRDEREGRSPVKKQLKQVVESGLRMASDHEGDFLAKLTFEGKKVTRKRRKLLPDAWFHSEWSGISILQSDWRPKSPRLTVDFSQQAVKIELQSRSKLLVSTEWCPEILADGVPLESKSGEEWESVCWYTDSDADYLELELSLMNGWRIQRQFLLGRTDGFLFASDNLIRSEATSLRDRSNEVESEWDLNYRLTLPLAPSAIATGNPDSREGAIRNKKTSAVVIPTSLPEWRSDSRFGDFHLRDNAMELHQRGQGSGLNASLFVDLNPKRFGAPLTWRQLTVAETRRAVSRDEAVGYRIQIGGAQWLAYRSLIGPGNRTLLGHNVASDFLFARLSMDGQAEALVEVE